MTIKHSFTIAWVAALISSAAPAMAESLALLHTDGSHLADSTGRRITLKGCNLGNWFMIEPWMLGGCLEARDQDQILTTLRQRFGEERTEQLIDLYRAGYVTPRDFELVKSFGFNVVRLPFDYRMIQNDSPPYSMRPDAFKWLDRAVELAEAAGVYVILDLHGAPGGQSNRMHTGKADVNQLFTNPEDQTRTVTIWHALSEHFRDRATIAAYDLLNEPYGDYNTDLRPALLKLMPRCYNTIRDTGDQHVIFLPGAIRTGISFYGDPHARGWKNVGFTEHNYAGLFSKQRPTPANHIRVLDQTFPQRKAYVEGLGVPYYLGEFNVVLDSAGGATMMRRYYDRTSEYGWPVTMWSYKLLKPTGGSTRDPWYMVTNAKPLPVLDLRTSSYEDFQQFFTAFGTMELTVNEPLRKALTAP